MKTRSTSAEPLNIAAAVKARRTARIGSPSSRSQTDTQQDDGSNPQPDSSKVVPDKAEELQSKSRQGTFR